MLKLLKRRQETLIVGVLLLLPLGSFLASGHTARPLNPIDRATLAVLSPLQKGTIYVVDGVGGGLSGYFWLVGVGEENERLAEENRRLKARIAAFDEIARENGRLTGLLELTDETPGEEVVARVIGVNPTASPLSVRIDRGSAAGVTAGLPVITPEGVVGWVLRSTASYADVLLLSDSSARIGVRARTSRARATAVGTGRVDLALSLENALRTDPLTEGEAVVTSGTDGIFPAGLPVGTLRDVKKRPYGLFQSAAIDPEVDVSTLEEVVVLTSRMPVSSLWADGGNP